MPAGQAGAEGAQSDSSDSLLLGKWRTRVNASTAPVAHKHQSEDTHTPDTKLHYSSDAAAHERATAAASLDRVLLPLTPLTLGTASSGHRASPRIHVSQSGHRGSAFCVEVCGRSKAQAGYRS